ncbi:hypothetical protein [Paenibacillus sp. 2KB_22]|uniref:hypothetical protein n=1 Tax=Paenibacillus sp. 2KB_22 TaxID=3232978 RepID=UPI003F99659B
MIKPWLPTFWRTKDYVVLFFKTDSSKVLYFREHPQYIRNLWFKGLLDPSILAALLRNDLIPNEQKEEALESIIQSNQTIFPESIREEDMSTLITKSFPKVFKRIAFEERNISSFEYANHAKRWTVVWYIKKYGLDEAIVLALSLTFIGDHPWHLKDALKEMFSEDHLLKSSFVRISEEKGYRIPTLLGF